MGAEHSHGVRVTRLTKACGHALVEPNSSLRGSPRRRGWTTPGGGPTWPIAAGRAEGRARGAEGLARIAHRAATREEEQGRLRVEHGRAATVGAAGEQKAPPLLLHAGKPAAVALADGSPRVEGDAGALGRLARTLRGPEPMTG